MATLAFDVTQKERGRIFENYKILCEQLNSQGHTCKEFDEPLANITDFSEIEVLILACPDNSKFFDAEIKSILNFVENGGGLLILSHAGGDKGLRTNLRQLTGRFDFYFNNDEVFDFSSNLGYQSYVIIKNLQNHSITEKVPDFCYRIGCSLTVKNNATILAYSSDSASPEKTPILTSTEYKKGRIVGLGSYEIFRDEINGGINYENNLKLALNIFNWLVKNKKNENIVKINDFSLPNLQKNQTSTAPENLKQPNQNQLLNKMIITINNKFNEMSEIQTRIEKELKKINERINLLEEKITIKINNTTVPTELNDENNQKFETEFVKASDLLQNNSKNTEKSEILSKIDICRRLLSYLDNQLELKSITNEEYLENKQKIILKIQDFENRLLKK
ncbi:MAG: hypothetical protein ACTSR3_18220 [Candidatus Helarchaeota archaeon]